MLLLIDSYTRWEERNNDALCQIADFLLVITFSIPVAAGVLITLASLFTW